MGERRAASEGHSPQTGTGERRERNKSRQRKTAGERPKDTHVLSSVEGRNKSAQRKKVNERGTLTSCERRGTGKSGQQKKAREGGTLTSCRASRFGSGAGFDSATGRGFGVAAVATGENIGTGTDAGPPAS
jgi:hypothetical protein